MIRRQVVLIAVGLISCCLLFAVLIPYKKDSILDNATSGHEIPTVGRKLFEYEQLWGISDGKFDEHLMLRERYQHMYRQVGYCFDEDGVTRKVTAKVNTSLVHSFSPYLERETAKRFIDPPHNQVFFANSPAIKWFNGELVMVARMWIDRERYESKQNWPPNHFADNWLITQKFDRFLKPINNASIMGIPLPKQWWVGDGPIEPRLCSVKNKLFVTFNAAMSFGYDRPVDFTILWDYNENLPIIPEIAGNSPMINATKKGDIPRDKHWMAFTRDDELYFVQNLDPLKIMHCTVGGFCKFVHTETNRHGFVFHDAVSHLRGGTPFEHYRDNYFIGLAHCTLFKRSDHNRYYTAHIVVLHVDPYRIVYVGNDVEINPVIYKQIPIVRPRWIVDGFIFPVGLVVEDLDTIIIGVHVNDHSSVLLRMHGIRDLMEGIIKEDIRSSPSSGPPVGTLQEHVHHEMEKTKNMGYEHKSDILVSANVIKVNAKSESKKLQVKDKSDSKNAKKKKS